VPGLENIRYQRPTRDRRDLFKRAQQRITLLRGDGAIIMAFGMYSEEEARTHKPKVVFPHAKNTNWWTPEEIVKDMLVADARNYQKGFDAAYVNQLALKMAFTPEEVVGFIAI
jgi:hypothetical protein